MAIKPGTEISVNKKGSSGFKEGDEISPISSSKSNLQNQQQNAVKTASRYQAMTVHEKRLLEEEAKDAHNAVVKTSKQKNGKATTEAVKKYNDAVDAYTSTAIYSPQGAKDMEKKTATGLDLPLKQQLLIDSAKEKYKNKQPLSFDEIKAVSDWAKQIAATSNTTPLSYQSMLAKITGVEYTSSPTTGKDVAKSANQNLLSPFKSFIEPLEDAVDRRVKKDISYLTDEEQAEYNRKKAVSDFEAETYYKQKSNDIAFKKGAAMANDYINGGFAGQIGMLDTYIQVGAGQALGGQVAAIEAIKSFLSGEKTSYKNTPSATDYANYFLDLYFEENGNKVASVIQDITTNISQNLTASAVGTITGSSALGKLSFGLSVFGNAYQSEIEAGYSQNEALQYALTNAFLEVGLSSLANGIPGLKSLSDEGIDYLCRNIATNVLRGIAKTGFKGLSETVEEGLQRTIDPFVRNWILKEDNKTVVTDFGSESKDILYEGFIGGLSALLMNSAGSVSGYVTDAQLTQLGKNYKYFADENGISIKNIAEYGKSISSDNKSQLYKLSKGLLNNIYKETDYNVGLLCREIVDEVGSANKFVNTIYGKNIKSSENGISNVFAEYDAAVNKGSIYPAAISYEVESLRDKVNSNAEVTDAEIGKVARDVSSYAVKAKIEGELKTALSQTSENFFDTMKTGGQLNAENNERGFEKNQGNQALSKGKSYNKREYGESAEAFGRRITEEGSGAGGKAWSLVKGKKSQFAYVPKSLDNSEGAIAVKRLNRIGIKAVYCDGETQSNINGVTTIHPHAVTAPDGTIYVSSSTSLSSDEIFYHEIVHQQMRNNTPAFADFQQIIRENIIISSDSFAKFCLWLKSEYFGENFDIENVDNFELMFEEIICYVNEAVSIDPSYAQELFSGMFENWSEITAAVEKFNKDMGADFSESAFSMPSDTLSAQSGSNLTQEQKNLNAVLSAATNGMKRSYPLNTEENRDIINLESAENHTVKYSPEQHKAAVLRYKSSESYHINAALRENETLSEAEQEFVDTLDEALLQLPTYEGTVYRNLTFDDFGGEEAYNEFLRQHLTGSFVSYNSYTSCSTKADGYPVEGKFKISLIIESQSGRNVDGFGNNMESEIIFPRNCDFIVDKIITQNGTPTIYLQEVSSNESEISLERSDAVRDLQTPYTENGDMQSVSERNTERNQIGTVRPQQTSSSRQRDSVRTEGQYGAVLSPESKESISTQATSDTEVASFVPENERSEVFENGEENNTPETQNPVSEEFEEDFEEENGSFFDEPSAEFPKPNLIEDIGAKAAGVTRYGEGQRIIIRIGKNLGYKVVFDPELKTKMGATSNGKIDFDNKIIYLNPAVSKPLQFIFGHEITHFGTASETFEEFIEPIRKTNLYLKWLQRKTGSDSSSVGLLEGLYRERVMESRKNADPMGAAEAQEEMYADFCGETFFSDGERGLTRLLNSLEGKKRSKVMQFIHDFVSYLKEKLSGNKDITLQLIRLESKFADLLKSAKENTAHNSGVKYSFEGYAQDGKGKYKSNFPKGTPKSAKSERILNYIKNVWSKKPIRLKIENNGEIRYIEAKFDPAYDETGNTPTDASKLMGGNRHGTSSEQRVTLDLADDYYQIASESTYNYSKDETGKNNPTHNDVTKWHYFVNDIYFSEFDSNEYIPYRVTINVKERSDGEFVYSFSAEKTEKLSTPRTLHAVVNEGNNSNANAQLSNNKLSQKQPVVKNKYMQKKEKHSISIDEGAENDTETDTDIGDIPSAMEELMQQYQNGDFGEDIFRARMDEIYNEALNRFGVIPEGENAETPISVPQKISEDKITRRFVRTILETGKLTSDMIADVEGEILLGDMMSYEEVSNETAMKRADRSFERGTAEADWQMVISGGVISETDIAIGEKLLLKAIEDNDRLKVLDLSSELSDIFTRSGRVVQAARMLKKMSGVGRLMTAQRNVTTINQSLAEKYGDRKDIPKVKLDPNLARQLAEAQSFEDTEVVYQNVLQDIAAQVPATVMDKLNAWRYFAMLANPRTHVRNLVSNTVFASSVMIKNILATSAEHLIIRDASKRTKAIFIKKEYLEFAKKDIKSREAKTMLEGKGQLDDKGMIQELRRTFDSDFLENLTKGNSNLLEKEDMWFKSVHYRNALAGFLQARKVDLNNVSEATLLQAREYAVKEAKKATFQDASVLADLLNNIKTPKNRRGDTAAEAVVLAAKIGVEGVLPFKRTPINIVKRGIEYSPLGLAETITVGLFNVRKGKISVSEFCDGLASGITGTALMAIGYFLASAGWAIGGFGDDDEDKFRQLNGEQEYSVQIFGKSYTIDWAAPAAIPFFIGVELADELKNGDGFQAKDIGEIAWNALEPITNLSMLSGLQGLIETVKYVDSSRTFGAMVGDIGISFGMQLVPSFFGGISRTIDNTQRTWYNDKNSQLGNTAQTIKNNMQAKIPGLSFTQAPSIDAWGREKKRGSVGERIAENFISPGYYSEIDYDSADTELMRLAKATGEGVFPKQAEKSFSIGGETKYLTADEWVTFAKAKGEYSFDYIHEFIESDSYEKLTDEQRVKVIDNLYEYAKAKAKTTVSDYDLMKGYKSVTNFERNGGSAVTYYVRRAILN